MYIHQRCVSIKMQLDLTSTYCCQSVVSIIDSVQSIACGECTWLCIQSSCGVAFMWLCFELRLPSVTRSQIVGVGLGPASAKYNDHCNRRRPCLFEILVPPWHVSVLAPSSRPDFCGNVGFCASSGLPAHRAQCRKSSRTSRSISVGLLQPENIKPTSHNEEHGLSHALTVATSLFLERAFSRALFAFS